ncbi:MAG: zinc-dependent alcohol dehydrogenase family protein [Chloroflexi bacterium]|nr:zinc-dependent alcohol dehydrogenase family protein [Chloroflexota bacterium]
MRLRAAVLREMGTARPYSTSAPVTIEDVDLEPPGPGEVLVQVAAAGLCHSDLSVINGSRPRPMPMVLGHEAAGVVVELGLGVTGVERDDHVVFSYMPSCGRCVPCQSGRPALCEPGADANARGVLLNGARRLRDADGGELNHHLGVSAFAEYAVVAEASLVRVGRDVPLDRAALFGCAVLTGVGAVVNTARAQAGESAAVFGLGGVGLSAVMGAQLAGCYPIVAVDLLEAKLDLARQAGATHTVRANDPDALAAIRDLTGGGAHYAFEAVGDARVLSQAYAATRRGGTTVAVGLPHPDQEVPLRALSLVAEERTLKGSYMGSAVPRRDVPRYLALYAAGRLPVDLLSSGTLAFGQLNEGFERLAQGAVVRQVLTPAP